MDNARHKIRFSITSQLIIVTSAILILTVVVLNTVIFLGARELIKSHIFYDLSNLSKSKSRELMRLIESDFMAADMFSSRVGLRKNLEELAINRPIPKETTDELSRVLNTAISVVPYIAEITVLGLDGKIIVSTANEESIGKNLSFSPLF